MEDAQSWFGVASIIVDVGTEVLRTALKAQYCVLRPAAEFDINDFRATSNHGLRDHLVNVFNNMDISEWDLSILGNLLTWSAYQYVNGSAKSKAVRFIMATR